MRNHDYIFSSPQRRDRALVSAHTMLQIVFLSEDPQWYMLSPKRPLINKTVPRNNPETRQLQLLLATFSLLSFSISALTTSLSQGTPNSIMNYSWLHLCTNLIRPFSDKMVIFPPSRECLWLFFLHSTQSILGSALS